MENNSGMMRSREFKTIDGLGNMFPSCSKSSGKKAKETSFHKLGKVVNEAAQKRWQRLRLCNDRSPSTFIVLRRRIGERKKEPKTEHGIRMRCGDHSSPCHRCFYSLLSELATAKDAHRFVRPSTGACPLKRKRGILSSRPRARDKKTSKT